MRMCGPLELPVGLVKTRPTLPSREICMSYIEFVSAAEEAALVAGRILQDWSGRFTVSEKGPADLVTEADVAAQTAIHQILRARFPEHGFLGEEGLDSAPGAEFRWIIDPLDGTS